MTAKELRFAVEGMTCAACSSRVERALNKVPGVETASVNLATEAASVRYDPATVAPEQLIRAVQDAGYGVGTATADFGVTGMTCAACVGRVERALKKTPGVLDASVNLATERASVRYSPTMLTPEDLYSAVEAAGYGAERPPLDHLPGAEGATAPSPQQQASAGLRRDLLLSAAFAVPLFLISMGPMLYPPLHHWLLGTVGEGALNWIMLALALPVQFWVGQRFYRSGWAALRHGSPDMNTLVMIGTTAAFAYSALVTLFPGLLPPAAQHVYFEASGVVITLVLLGKYLESLAKSRSSGAMRALLELRPPEAWLLEGGTVQRVPAESVRRGQQVQVRTGEQVPVDGVIVSGESYLDESMLTGESVPVSKGPGDEVTGGTLNGSGLLTVEATRVGADSALAQIVALVEQAQSEKPPIQGLADRVVSVFVPVVLVIAALTFGAWLLWGGEAAVSQALIHAVAVLIIACPCAMGLATPVSVMVGSGKAAELGVLFGGGRALEELHRVDVVALDKTGTLTAGQPSLTALHLSPTAGLDDTQVLALAASAETGSDHPLAHALLSAAQERSLTLTPAARVKTEAGYGIEAEVAGHTVQLGAARYMERLGLPMDAWTAALDELGSQAATPVFVAVDGSIAALLGVSDPLKPGSREAVAQLHRQGYRVMMVTGDSWATARAIAEQVGLDPQSEVRAEVLPADKAAVIEELQTQGLKVAMVGDGINDAPALARADVGVALGTGTDVAAQTADVLLMSGDLRGVPNAAALSAATLRNIRMNLFWAFAYNVLLIPVAAGLFTRWGLSLSPVLAAAAMGLSSVFVMSNALRLRGFRAPLGHPESAGAGLTPALSR
ncbi:ATPase [Deinococcus piscis]|uniref:ATPase n=1 Tax=Deinococcus piscis TaxID=394230 RepID=A0ABQ3K7E9_9DEIO|nr:heavy metal translocating P-type ATPase [Deinococcus piscis]GHG05303.1 ATPase [Deinococcus piscis]